NARVNNVVSDFMREFEQSPLYAEPVLRVIENRTIADNVPASVFQLNVSRK
ncbi:MAG: PilN domain-containing protein, partial [Candidatus Competibacteraceae bacterium]|nr:PilN domain-containing protein [Candidatus Competibacteraceae bacterium]